MKPWNYKELIKDNLNLDRELIILETTNGEINKALPISPFGWVVKIPTEGSVFFTLESAGNNSNAISIGGVFDKSLKLDDDEYAYLPKDGKKIISIKTNGDVIVNTEGKVDIKSSSDIMIEGGNITAKGTTIIMNGDCKFGSDGASFTPLCKEDIGSITYIPYPGGSPGSPVPVVFNGAPKVQKVKLS